MKLSLISSFFNFNQDFFPLFKSARYPIFELINPLPDMLLGLIEISDPCFELESLDFFDGYDVTEFVLRRIS